MSVARLPAEAAELSWLAFSIAFGEVPVLGQAIAAVDAAIAIYRRDWGDLLLAGIDFLPAGGSAVRGAKLARRAGKLAPDLLRGVAKHSDELGAGAKHLDDVADHAKAIKGPGRQAGNAAEAVGDAAKATKSERAAAGAGVGAASIAAQSARHHPFPMYLGGAIDQTLKSIPKKLHYEFHAALDKFKGGIYSRRKGAASFADADKETIIKDLIEFYKTALGGKFKQYLPDFLRAVKESGF